MAEEECFPRGKPPKVKSSFAIKKPKLKIDQPSNLFRENPTVINEKPERFKDRKRKTELEGWSKAEQEELDLTNNRLKSVDYLTFTKMHEGMLLLGCVKEIYELEMLISLPNCNTGYVRANRISAFYTDKLQHQLQSIGTETEDIASLSDLFQVGQLVICCVSGLNPITKNVQLCLDPQYVNEGVLISHIKNGQHLSGVIKSIEDHGYIVDIGKKNVNAFIPFKQADSNITLVEGNVIRCIVTSVKGDGKILTLSNDAKKLKKTLPQSDHGKTLDSLLPGSLVKFRVTKDMERGQIGDFHGFEGSVSYIHSLSSNLHKPVEDSVKTKTSEKAENSSDDEQKEPIKKRRKKGGKKLVKNDELQEAESQNSAQKKEAHDSSDTLVACILYITASKHVALATNPKIWKEADRMEMIDSIQENYVIGQKCKFFAKQKLKGIGLVGQLEKNGPTGIVLIKNLSDNRIDITMSDLPEKKSYKAKVINNCNVEGIVELTLKRSMLEAAFLRFEDVKVGGVVQAKVLSVNHRGFLVMIGSGKDEFRGCGNLKGFIAFMHVSDIVLQHPEKKFAVSDVVTCRVSALDTKRRFIHLTCKTTLVKSKLPIVTSYDQIEGGQIVQGYISAIKDYGCILKFYNDVKGLVPKSQLSAEVVENPQKTFFIGQVMKARVLTCDPDKNNLKLSFCLTSKKSDSNKGKDDTFTANKIVSVEVQSKEQNGFKVLIINKDSDRKNWIRGKLFKEHLSDFISISQDLFATISVGDVLESCVTYTRKSAVYVSMKKSIFGFASSRIDLPLTFADLQEGQIVPGFIQQITAFGVFVYVANGLVGLCPKSMMTDYYLESTNDHLYEGQSVIAKVAEVNLEKRRFLLSLRPSECEETKMQIVEYDSQRNELVEMGSDLFKDLSMGSVVDITCQKESESQVVAINGIDNDFSCILLEELENDLNKAVVVYVDVDQRQVFLTTLKPVIKYYEKSSKDKTASKDVVFVNVIYMNDDISIGYISNESNSAGSLVVVSTNLHCNDSNHMEKRIFKIGQTVKSEILKRIDNKILLGKLQLKPGIGKRIRKDSEMTESAVLEHEFKNIKIGQQVVGSVKSIKPTYALVHFEDMPGLNKQVTGRLHISEILKDAADITMPLKNLKVGQTISCYVIGCRDVFTHHFLDITNTRRATSGVLELSLFRKKAEYVVSDSQTVGDIFSVGSYVTAYVKSFDKKHKCFQTEVIPGVKALLPQLFASEDPEKVEKSKTHFRPGTCLKCHVIKNDGEMLHIAKTGSLVSSTTGGDATEMESGCVVNVEIRKLVSDGLLVHGEFDLKGKVFVSDFFDEFRDNPFQYFHQGQIVRCCVVDNTDTSNTNLSLRKSSMHSSKGIKPVDHVIDIKSLKKKQILRGYIKSCSPSGIFVTLSRGVSGRVTFSKATKYYVADQKEAEKIFFPGKVVKCCVLNFMPRDGRVELSMLSRDTKSDDVIPSTTDLPLRKFKRKGEENEDLERPKMAKIESKAVVERLIKETKIESYEVQVETTSVSKQGDVTEHDDVMEEPGFVWDENADDLGRSSEDGDSGIEDHVEKGKRNEKINEKNEEREIMEREKELMDGERTPQSASEWERMMISNPQSSMLWVRYMAFHLHLTETDKARAVAEKALKTISFREEQEKLNVWVALLNLENLYGTAATLEQTLERAMQQNDQLKVLTHLVKIFTESGKLTEADETYQKMLKKFRKDKDVWIAYLKHLMINQRFDQANLILKRSTEALDKKQHLEVISKFAQFQFSFGEPEKGKTIMENTLITYPKRTDIWSMYIDTLIKAKRIEEARIVLERVTTISISSKKMRSFFKRFVEFESKYGNEDGVNQVKQKAIDYMEAQINKGMDD